MPVIGKAASLAQGATPIIIRWDYNALADRDTLKGNPEVDVVVPKTGVVAGVYVQAISAFAPHPNAAKLWMEYLYSDEGQLAWLKGYCHPIRFNDLAKNDKIPADLLAKLPPAGGLRRGRVPDPRAAGCREGSHHQAVGQGRRRQREVAAEPIDRRRRPVSGRRRTSLHVSGPELRPTCMTQADEAVPLNVVAARPRVGHAVLGVARRRAVLRLRASVPDPADRCT